MHPYLKETGKLSNVQISSFERNFVYTIYLDKAVDFMLSERCLLIL